MKIEINGNHKIGDSNQGNFVKMLEQELENVMGAGVSTDENGEMLRTCHSINNFFLTISLFVSIIGLIYEEKSNDREEYRFVRKHREKMVGENLYDGNTGR